MGSKFHATTPMPSVSTERMTTPFGKMRSKRTWMLISWKCRHTQYVQASLSTRSIPDGISSLLVGSISFTNTASRRGPSLGQRGAGAGTSPSKVVDSVFRGKVLRKQSTRRPSDREADLLRPSPVASWICGERHTTSSICGIVDDVGTRSKRDCWCVQ